MRLLYLVPYHTYTTKMSRVRFQQVAAIRETVQGALHISGPGWPDWDDAAPPAAQIRDLPVFNGHPAEAVVAYGVGGLAGSPVPVVVQFNEAEDHATVERIVDETGARLVVFHHWGDLSHYGHWPGFITRVHIPHGADPAVYRDYGLDKDIDVLCAGNMNAHYYPFRVRLAALATRVLRKRGWRVVVLPHPGYTLPPRAGTVVGEDFARMLNRAKLVVTCSMRYKYQLAKYAEVALCKSLALADLPDECGECRSVLEQTVFVADPAEHDGAIRRRIEDLLDDESGELVRLTALARDTAERHLTMGVYAARFVHAVARHLLEPHAGAPIGGATE